MIIEVLLTKNSLEIFYERSYIFLMKKKAMPLTDHMKDYLFITELWGCTSYALKSVYNIVSQGIFKERTHYFNPRQKRTSQKVHVKV